MSRRIARCFICREHDKVVDVCFRCLKRLPSDLVSALQVIEGMRWDFRGEPDYKALSQTMQRVAQKALRKPHETGVNANLEQAAKLLSDLILATPSGDLRDSLTDINILIHADILREKG